jgi:hypothetical protein
MAFCCIIRTASFKEVMICPAEGKEKGKRLKNIN